MLSGHFWTVKYGISQKDHFELLTVILVKDRCIHHVYLGGASVTERWLRRTRVAHLVSQSR
jgi:hypothetical protein